MPWSLTRGQTVAIVVEDNRYLAEDAAQAVAVDFEALPAVSDPRDAAKPDAARLLRDELGRHTLIDQALRVALFHQRRARAACARRSERHPAHRLEATLAGTAGKIAG